MAQILTGPTFLSRGDGTRTVREASRSVVQGLSALHVPAYSCEYHTQRRALVVVLHS